MNPIINDVKKALINSIDPKTLASSDRFFKEGEAAKYMEYVWAK